MATQNTFEGGSAGVSITPGNSGGASGTPVDAAWNTNSRYTATSPLEALISAEHSSVAGQANLSHGTPDGVTVASGLTHTAIFLIRWDGSFTATRFAVGEWIGIGTFSCEYRTTAAGVLEIRTSGGTLLVSTSSPGITNGTTFTASVGTRYCVGVKMVPGAATGRIELTLWNYTTGALIETWTSAATQDTLQSQASGAVHRWRLGICGPNVTRVTITDDVRTADTNYPALVANQTVTSAGGIASAEAMGAGTVTSVVTVVSAGGIASAEAFGPGTVTPGAVTIVSGGGIASAEAMGPGTVSATGALVAAAGIPSAEAFGAGAVIRQQFAVSGGGIASAQAMGVGAVSTASTTAGPIIGAVTATGAQATFKLANVTPATAVRLVVSLNVGLTGPVFSAVANPDANGWVKTSIAGLTANTPYFVGVEVAGNVLGDGRGDFLTDPVAMSQASFSVAFGSCNQTNPSGLTYQRIAARVGAFGTPARRLIHMGDLWYAAYLTDAEVEAAYANVFSDPQVKPYVTGQPFDYCWDNNDWGGPDSDASYAGADELAAGFRAYLPHYPLPATDGKGIWHAYTIGRVRFIVLDTRSQRSPRTDPESPSKVMLGNEQRNWLATELQGPEPLKIICSSIPWREFGGVNGDRWQSYSTEWDTVNDLIDLHANGRVFVIFGDRHALCADDGSQPNTRGRPQAGGAPFNQGSVALPGGEVWSHGYWCGPGGTAQAVTLYGWLDIADTGSNIEVAYDGRSSDDEVTRVSMSIDFEANQTITSPAGIPSGEAFGAGLVSHGGAATIIVSDEGIPSAEAFGLPGYVALMNGGAEMAPCSWSLDEGCLPADWSSNSLEMRERAAAWATEILWALSGRRFGPCPVTVRPCSGCNVGSYEEWGVWLDSGSGQTWFPYVWNGTWRNCGCKGICGCSASQEVWLPAPVAGIVEVRIDGIVVPSTAYRVDNGNLLVRDDGGVWPEQQDFDLPAGQPGTFIVTYLKGTVVPRAGQIAAAALAYDFIQACTGGQCRIPQGVQSIVRQGVEMTLIPEDQLDWLTGIREADAFLRAFNPSKLTRAPRVVSVDLVGPRVTTWGA